MDFPKDHVLTKNDLVAGFKAVGLEAGMHVVCHSAMRFFGRRIENGADDIIDALEEIITPAGTLVMPTFSSHIGYFLEVLHARCGEAGFRGTLHEFWSGMKEHAESEGGFSLFPYDTPQEFWGRMHDEGMFNGNRKDWEVGPAERDLSDDDEVFVRKNGPALPPDELRPERMPINTGKIPATYSLRPETRRSEQFSGSFTAWGAMTDRILERHDNHSSKVFEDHPLYRMKDIGGKILLIGINHGNNSTVHVAEAAAIRARSVDIPNEYLGHFMVLDEPLTQMGAQSLGKIADAEIRLVDTRALYRLVADILDEKLKDKAGSGTAEA